MGKTGREWSQIYTIYGIYEWQTLAFLLTQAIIFTCLSIIFLIYFDTISTTLHSTFPSLPSGTARFIAGFMGSFMAISAACLFISAANYVHSAVSLHWEVAQRMVNAISDWSTVRHALDVGCGRGMLLNTVAMQLKKSGSSGHVVGLDRDRTAMINTLRTAGMEGVQKYVTCREADLTSLPFCDNYFDVAFSGAFLHTVGKQYGVGSELASSERMRFVTEFVRVLKPGGVGVVWDLSNSPEHVQRLKVLKMEEIRVSERITAFMVGSHIVSFRKPRHPVIELTEVRLDWR